MNKETISYKKSSNLSHSLLRSHTMSALIDIFQQYKDLKTRGIQHPDCIPIEDGNMNLVLKVKWQGKSYIIKHSPPWVHKYPDIEAPQERSLHESYFYQSFVLSSQLADQMPQYIGYDDENKLIMLSYIENSYSGSLFYLDDSLKGIPKELNVQVLNYFSGLHKISRINDFKNYNDKLISLNHHHIFELPINNNLHLDNYCEGLRALSQTFLKNDRLIQTIIKLGTIFLDPDHKALIHGDLYPGSLLISDHKIYVIDPEFSTIGSPEFDLGVYFAHHLILGGKLRHLNELVNLYLLNFENPNSFNINLCFAFSGCEIIRRLLGAARLPLKWNFEKYHHVLNMGKDLCLAFHI